ncbi:hypothetical protein MMC14_010614, partial [Varicellaria rhodocarpa]|nr:hypothetical protein [Varicellaria rhodocarpa]
MCAQASETKTALWPETLIRSPSTDWPDSVHAGALAGACDMPVRKRSKRAASQAAIGQMNKENAAANVASKRQTQSKHASRPTRKAAPVQAD